MTNINLSVLLAAACLVGGVTGAIAGPYVPVTLTNSTSVESYSSTSPTGPTNGFFPSNASGNAYWGTNIGQPVYQTPQATISFIGNTVNIAFQTGLYTGADNALAPTDVYAADVFLNALAHGVNNANGPLPGTGGSSFYNYAISLGFDSHDCGSGANAASCGATTAGLYTIPNAATVTATNGAEGTYLTSQDVWNGRSGFTYGGQYGTAACDATNAAADSPTCATASVSPTVLTEPTADRVTGITVGVACYDGTGLTASGAPLASNSVACGGQPNNNQGILDVSLTANSTGAGLATNLALLSSIFSNFDLFWGTGDCSNAPIWGDVSSLTHAAPEPSSMALFASAALGFRMLRRRKRKALSAA